jgi:amino acid transporter
MIFGACGMAVIMACVAEVASQFSEPGGPYLYVRNAFGRFFGIQVGWFHLLAVTGAMAALANLFVNYLATLLPSAANASERPFLMALLIAIPAAANYVGVRSGAALSSVLTAAKLSPLVLLILVGVAHFVRQPRAIHASEIWAPGFSNWINAMGLLLFAFGGWEDALIPSGEVKEPRQTIPFAAATGLLSCGAIYMLLQFTTVATIGTSPTDRPLAETASLLLGRGGGTFVALAVMISTYGWISGAMLEAPRLAYSLAAYGDFPRLFARFHPRFHTPALAIVFFALAGWVLAFTGTFLWVVELSAGSMMVYYAATCASLIRLRKLRPHADALRVPCGPLLSMVAIAISLALMTGLKRREIVFMCVTALLAATNWLLAKRESKLILKAAASQD